MKNEKVSLTAIVITRNSEKKIKDCLRSLQFADEVLVIDSGSTDKTIGIAKELNAKIFSVEPKGYSYSRNIGAQKAIGEWLLYVDADERVSDALTEKVLRAINPLTHQSISVKDRSASGGNSFRIYRKNIILGKWLKHGGWWPDPVHRLIKKSALKEWTGKLHEYPIIDKNIGLITEPIVHLSKDSISEMVKNSRDFAPIEAQLKLDAGHPPVRVYHFLLAMWREFWNRGIIRAGWIDGPIGILEVFYQMFHQVLIYSILWQMQQPSLRHPKRPRS